MAVCDTLQGNCSSSVAMLPVRLQKHFENSRHCIIDFQHRFGGFDVPDSSSLWLTDLTLMNAGIPEFRYYDSHVLPGRSSEENHASAHSLALTASNVQASDERTSPTQICSTDASRSLCGDCSYAVNGGVIRLAAGNDGKGAKLFAQRVLFHNNHAMNGGAVGLHDFASAQLIDCVFDSNRAHSRGGKRMLCFHVGALDINKASLEGTACRSIDAEQGC